MVDLNNSRYTLGDSCPQFFLVIRQPPVARKNALTAFQRFRGWLIQRLLDRSGDCPADFQARTREALGTRDPEGTSRWYAVARTICERDHDKFPNNTTKIHDHGQS